MKTFYIIFKQSEEQYRTKDKEEAIEYFNELSRQWDEYVLTRNRQEEQDRPKLFKVIQQDEEVDMIELKANQDENQLELSF